eukprot:1418406-Amphidinium_carterae.1
MKKHLESLGFEFRSTWSKQASQKAGGRQRPLLHKTERGKRTWEPFWQPGGGRSDSPICARAMRLC